MFGRPWAISQLGTADSNEQGSKLEARDIVFLRGSGCGYDDIQKLSSGVDDCSDRLSHKEFKQIMTSNCDS